MNKKLFNQNINDILTDGNIENQKLEQLDVLKYLFSDNNIKTNLYRNFIDNSIYVNKLDDLFAKTQDMVYRIHYVIKNYLNDQLHITDKKEIKRIITELIRNDMDFYSAVSFDDLDKEILLDAEFVCKDSAIRI